MPQAGTFAHPRIELEVRLERSDGKLSRYVLRGVSEVVTPSSYPTNVSTRLTINSHRQSVQLPKAAKNGLFRAIKAGVRGEFVSSESGTPQGGVISPLLANIVLHGLENVGEKVRYKKRSQRYTDTIKGLRYADDVVSATRCRML